MPVRAGTLRFKVIIQSQTTSTDGYGEPSNTWASGNSVWANIEPLSGAERDVGEGLTGIVDTRITIRYDSTATPKKRLLFGSRIFGIEAVINHGERDDYMTLFCQEEVN